MRSIAHTQRSTPRISFAQLVELFERKTLSGNGSIHPAQFFDRWIEKIYGVYPGETNYRQACLMELQICLRDVVSRESMIANWKWDGPKQSYPNYLPVMLFHVHRYYSVLDALNLLPRRSLYQQRGA